MLIEINGETLRINGCIETKLQSDKNTYRNRGLLLYIDSTVQFYSQNHSKLSLACSQSIIILSILLHSIFILYKSVIALGRQSSPGNNPFT